jgi:proline dehydrogenase
MIPPGVRNFVCGETEEEAVEYGKKLDNIVPMYNKLGEHYEKEVNAVNDKNRYIELIKLLDKSEIDSCISVKPTQLGLDYSEDLFRENLDEILTKAAKKDIFVWVDMEDSSTTDPTLKSFNELSHSYPDSIGICLQSNLKRTRKDIYNIDEGKIRLVKGAYNENDAYSSKERVNNEYIGNMELLNELDIPFAVASHDMNIINYATDYLDNFEIQMLMGVREEKQKELSKNYDFYQYAPYGEEWMSYFYRRIRENKSNLVLGFRNIF